MQTLLVTGGAGFIGSNYVRQVRALGWARVVNLDALTYAGNPENLASLAHDADYTLVHGSIADRDLVASLFQKHRPAAVVNFAAETHVDRSILGPDAFVQTNVHGTFALLEEAKRYWSALPATEKAGFRFLHVSTDEVYGSLSPTDPAFTEQTPYAPNSPYSASKAASDHFVRAYHHTYGLPVLTTNCSNNYGPFQFPEKLIPLVILSALEGKPLPVYGDGTNVRDWLYVEDHCTAITSVLQRGRLGETYNVGGCNEMKNIDVVRSICLILDELRPQSAHVPHTRLITFVKDRPGHDRRYAIDIRKIESELGWRPAESFETGIRKTVEWYLANAEWCRNVTSGAYQKWLDVQYTGAR